MAPAYKKNSKNPTSKAHLGNNAVELGPCPEPAKKKDFVNHHLAQTSERSRSELESDTGKQKPETSIQVGCGQSLKMPAGNQKP